MSLEMEKVASHTLPADFKPNSEWKHKLLLQCVRLSPIQTLMFSIQRLNDSFRWYLGLCNDCARPEGSAYVRSQEAAASCLCLGWCNAWNVQLPYERIQDQEWRLPFPFATFLGAE
jgi:hypothetical protein